MEIIQFQNPKIQEDLIYIHPDEADLTDRKKKYYAWIADCQRYYQRNPVKFIEDAFNLHLIDAQKLVIQMAWTTPNVLMNCTRGFGKALAVDTPVMTDKGYRFVAGIHPGDKVYGIDGKLTEVVAESPIWTNTCYDFSFYDEVITANEDHLWKVHTDEDTSEVLDSAELYKRVRGGSKFSVDLCEPMEFEQHKLPVHPYMLGLWFGSQSGENTVEVMTKDSSEICQKIALRKYTPLLRESDTRRRICVTLYNADGSSFEKSVMEATAYKLSIPANYLFSSVDDRKELLAGIIDANNQISLNQESVVIKDCKNLDVLLSGLGIKYRTIADESLVEIFVSQDMDLPVLNRIRASLPTRRVFKNKTREINDIQKAITTPTKCIQVARDDGLFLCGLHNIVTHNSTIMSMLLMAKGMLFNSYWTYIASGTANQSQQTFTTLENLANDKITTFKGSTGYIFKQEVVKNSSTGDGFVHATSGYHYELNNGSKTVTLSGNVDSGRGARGSVFFDESGFLSENMINVFSAFAIVDKNFKTGGSSDENGKSKSMSNAELMALPKEIPNQLFFISSASSTDTEFYRLYRLFSKKMLMGDDRYFVAEFTYEIAINPLQNGVPMNSTLLEQSTVDNFMHTNPERGLREYYCQFTSDAGDNAILHRDVINRNSEIRAPLLMNDTGDRKFVIAWDPARLADNSVIAVGEIFEDGDDYSMRIVNCINLVDINRQKRTPDTVKNQVDLFRKVLLEYNRGGTGNYSNIVGVYIDRGAGGQGPAIYDALTENWEDDNGTTHFGMLDLKSDPTVYNKSAVKDKLHMVEPAKYKPIIYDALIDLTKSDRIKFTQDYDNRGELITYVEQGKETVAKKIALDKDQQAALVNIDLMKDQLVNMVQSKSESGRIRFEITPEKRSKFHDDHAYACALLAFGLHEYRNKNKKVKDDFSNDELIKMIGTRIRKPKSIF